MSPQTLDQNAAPQIIGLPANSEPVPQPATAPVANTNPATPAQIIGLPANSEPVPQASPVDQSKATDTPPPFSLKALLGPTTAIGSEPSQDEQTELSGVSDVLHGSIAKGLGEVWQSEKPHVIPGSPIEGIIQYFNPDFHGAAVPQASPGSKPAVDFAQFVDKKTNPVWKALAEESQSLTSPANVAILYSTGGLGLVDSPAALAMANRLISTGFSAQAIGTAYQHLKAFAAAYDAGNANEAVYQLTHAVAAGTVSALAAADASGHPLTAAKIGDVAQAVIPDAVKEAAGELGGSVAGAARDKAAKVASAGEGRLARANTLLNRVQNPLPNDAAIESQKNALPDLIEIAQDQKPGAEITNPTNAVDAIDRRIAELSKPFSDATQAARNTNRSAGQLQDVSNDALQYVESELRKNPGIYTQDQISAALDHVQERLSGLTTVEELDNARRGLNEDASYTTRNTTGQNLDAMETGSRRASDYLRALLYSNAATDRSFAGLGVDAPGPGGVRAIRQRIGDLISVRDNLEKIIGQANKTGDWSVWNSVWKKMLQRTTLGGIVGGGAGPVGVVSGAALGAAEGGVEGVADYVTTKNKNVNTKAAFNHLSKLPPPGLPEATFTPTTGNTP